MDIASPDSTTAPSRPLSFATLLAFLGLVAIAVGWFLPWVARMDVGGIGVSGSDLTRLDEQARKEGAPEEVVAVIRRMRENEAVSGNDFAVLGRFWLDKDTTVVARERRGWTLGLAVMRWAPWVTAAAAALLLLGRMRKPGSLVLTLVLSVAILVGGFAGLMWLGSSQQAKDSVATDPKVLGLGIYAIAIGGLAALLGGLFAMRASTWWKAILLTVLAVTGVIVACVQYVGPP